MNSPKQNHSPSFKNLKSKKIQSPMELKEKMRKNYKNKVQKCRDMLLIRFRGTVDEDLKATLTNIYENTFDSVNKETQNELSDFDESEIIEEIKQELIQEELNCNEEYAAMLLVYGMLTTKTYLRIRETGNLHFQEPQVSAMQHKVAVDEMILHAFDEDPTTSIQVIVARLNNMESLCGSSGRWEACISLHPCSRWLEENESAQSDNIDWSSTLRDENVICLICQKHNFIIQNNNLSCPRCNINIKTSMCLPDIKRNINEVLDGHSNKCSSAVGFTLIEESNESHIYSICEHCADMQLIV